MKREPVPDQGWLPFWCSVAIGYVGLCVELREAWEWVKGWGSKWLQRTHARPSR